jgi:hypothetical protein
MATYSKLKLSGSTNGRQIKLAATSTPGTLIHTAVAGTVDMDEVWLYVTNNHTASLSLTIEFGGTASPDDLIQMSIPSKQGLYLIVPGFLLNNGLVIRAFAQTANLLCISGWVNRITN